MALDRVFSEVDAANMSSFADIMTATLSLHGAYKGVLFRSSHSLNAGSLGVGGSDVISTIHTTGELNRTLEGHKK
ncbi:hypothetical protein [Halopseudomonas salegens]|uniref:hypothetical protein n=1 Tax=Halopseudomonas salegens TaxID=1434072 RepID=UPI0012FE214B|nr:hypothetical protein [Halopseudomonas salegens]